jgi:hypothetical protein
VQRRQLGQLDPPAGQVGSGPDEQRIGPVARHGLERRIDLAIAVGIEDLDLQRHRVLGGGLPLLDGPRRPQKLRATTSSRKSETK